MTESDSLVLPVAVLCLSISLLFIIYLFNQLAATPTALISTMAPQVRQTLSLLANLIPLFMMAMSLGAIISSLFVRSHPILFPITLILIAVQMTITPMMSNIYSSIMQASAGMAATAALYPIITAIMNNLPLITFVLSMLGMLITYMRGGNQ